jgi:hypothetical protein
MKPGFAQQHASGERFAKWYLYLFCHVVINKHQPTGRCAVS